jgi:hypothetical protein
MQSGMSKQERTYCPGNRDVVWRGEDPKKCPDTAICRGCGREKSVSLKEEGGVWAAYVPIHLLPNFP